VEVVISETRLRELIAAQGAGHAPSTVTITVDGLTYGNAPDGSQQEWDNSTQKWLPVTALAFQFGHEVEDEQEPELIEPEETQRDPVLEALDALHAIVAGRSLWAVAILAIIAVEVLLRL
jgi:hypothetical protein